MDVERLGFGGGQHGVGAAQEGRQADVLGVVRDGVLVLDDAAAVVADLALAARRSFGRRPVRHAVARRGVEAEQLRAHAVVFEASAGAAVTATLSVQAEQFSWEDTRQNGVFVRTVVQTGGRLTVEEVIELGDAARGPFEAALGVAQVAHDVAVLPAAALRSRSAQIAGRR